MYYGEQNSMGTGINISSGIAGLRMPTVGEKQGEISLEFEMLHKASDELRANLSNLESKVSPILAPDRAEVDSKNGSVPERIRTPLAETIHQRTQDILNFNARICVLLERIEL